MITKVIFFLFLTSLYCNTSYAQELHLKNTNWKKENLKGNVQSYTEISQSKRFIVDEFNGQSKDKYIFNKQGLLIERGFNHERSYKYDEQGNQIEFRKCSGDVLIQEKCILSKYTYETKNGQTKIKFYEIREWLFPESDGDYTRKEWVYSYSNENIIKVEEYGMSGDKLDQEITYTYDSENNIIEEYSIYAQKEHSKNCYTYDSKNRVTQITIGCYLKNSTLVGTEKIISYKYDGNNNITEEKYGTYPENKINRMYTYKYKYDRKGNWKSCKKYDTDGLTLVTTRNYTYFDQK